MGCSYAGDEVSGDNADGLHVHFILLEQNASRPKLYYVLSQSSDESDDESDDEPDSDETDSEYDRDFPIPEDNPFGCCKTNLYFDRSDVPLLNTIFSTIDELFQSSETK